MLQDQWHECKAIIYPVIIGVVGVYAKQRNQQVSSKYLRLCIASANAANNKLLKKYYLRINVCFKNTREVKKTILFLFMLCPVMRSYAQDAQGIKFLTGSFDSALFEAKKQHKLLFVDCWSYSCGFCRKNDKEVFPVKEVGDFYNSNFICLSLNMDKDSGKRMEKDYKVTAYPTFLYLGPDGSVEHFAVGTGSPQEFIDEGKTALNPKTNTRGMVNSFKSNKKMMDTAYLYKIICATHDADKEQCEKALTLYWNLIPDSMVFVPRFFDVFHYAERDINSKAYKYVYKHQDQLFTKLIPQINYRAKWGNYAILAMNNDSNVLSRKAAEAENMAAKNHDTALFRKAKKIAFMARDDEGQYEACINELFYCRTTGQWKDCLGDIDKYLNTPYRHEYFVFSNFAYEMAKSPYNEEVLNKALQYADTSMAHGKAYYNVKTYALVLYKQGKLTEALIAANEALKYANEEEKDPFETNELISKIKKERITKMGTVK